MISIETKTSRTDSRIYDYLVKVDGVEIYQATSRCEAEFVKAWAASQN